MKVFEIITESDARVLPHGETVTLKRGGHITPLAQDTLGERRIIVVREGGHGCGGDSCARRRYPESRGGERPCGSRLRKAVIAFLRARGLAVDDLGTTSSEPVDYPDIAAAADAVARREADAAL